MSNYPGDDVAKLAFDVMMRRGWGTRNSIVGVWMVTTPTAWLWHEKRRGGYFQANDPFTALVEADKWYRENVEKHP